MAACMQTQLQPLTRLQPLRVIATAPTCTLRGSEARAARRRSNSTMQCAAASSRGQKNAAAADGAAPADAADGQSPLVTRQASPSRAAGRNPAIPPAAAAAAAAVQDRPLPPDSRARSALAMHSWQACTKCNGPRAQAWPKTCCSACNSPAATACNPHANRTRRSETTRATAADAMQMQLPMQYTPAAASPRHRRKVRCTKAWAHPPTPHSPASR